MVPLVPLVRQARLGRTAPQVRLVPQVQLGLVVLDLLAPLGLLALQVALVLLDLQALRFLMVVVTLLVPQVLTVTFI